MMPYIDGMQLAAAAPAHVRKVLLSGFVPEIAEKEMKALNVTVLGKPVPLKVLGKIIEEEMGRMRGELSIWVFLGTDFYVWAVLILYLWHNLIV